MFFFHGNFYMIETNNFSNTAIALHVNVLTGDVQQISFMHKADYM